MPVTVVLFHSALGLRPAVHAFADALRADGHTVLTPDLYDGRVFDALDEGVACRDALGVAELSARALAAVADLPTDLVYAGYSMGAASAEFLAVSRPGARGLLLMHGAIDPRYLGLERWPPVPVQLHYGPRDPWNEPEQNEALLAAVRAAGQPCEAFAYEAPGHLFTDRDSPDHDAADAALLLARARDFLARC